MTAAVPRYVTTEPSTCPPGHAFRIYFSGWRSDFAKKDDDETKRLFEVLEKPSEILRSSTEALEARQADVAGRVREGMFEMPAQTTAPLVTGVGIEHPLENGFAFSDPYGVPVLAGSLVKGCLRHAANDLEWPVERISEYFGVEPAPGSREVHRRGALDFWDAYPVTSRMRVDIMNPHYSDYYQNCGPPSDDGTPKPIKFRVFGGICGSFDYSAKSSRRGRTRKAVDRAGLWTSSWFQRRCPRGRPDIAQVTSRSEGSPTGLE